MSRTVPECPRRPYQRVGRGVPAARRPVVARAARTHTATFTARPEPAGARTPAVTRTTPAGGGRGRGRGAGRTARRCGGAAGRRGLAGGGRQALVRGPEARASGGRAAGTRVAGARVAGRHGRASCPQVGRTRSSPGSRSTKLEIGGPRDGGIPDHGLRLAEWFGFGPTERFEAAWPTGSGQIKRSGRA